jgi:signal recognition particle GTPase
MLQEHYQGKKGTSMPLSGEENPTLLLMAGLPGAGKTTLALALGRILHWPVVDKDTLKSTLLLADIPEQMVQSVKHM